MARYISGSLPSSDEDLENYTSPRSREHCLSEREIFRRELIACLGEPSSSDEDNLEPLKPGRGSTADAPTQEPARGSIDDKPAGSTAGAASSPQHAEPPDEWDRLCHEYEEAQAKGEQEMLGVQGKIEGMFERNGCMLYVPTHFEEAMLQRQLDAQPGPPNDDDFPPATQTEANAAAQRLFVSRYFDKRRRGATDPPSRRGLLQAAYASYRVVRAARGPEWEALVADARLLSCKRKREGH